MRLAGFFRFRGSAASPGGNGGKPPRARIRTILGFLLALDGVLVLLIIWPPGASPQSRQDELQRLRAEHEELSPKTISLSRPFAQT